MFECKVLADSVSPAGCRLTTLEVTFPRVILAEFNTHRMLSRNAASSRAIPTEKLIQRVIDDPFIPEFRANQKGMQAGEMLESEDAVYAREIWLEARGAAVAQAREMHELNIHKQYVNRLLEPWMWATVIVSATDWENLFALRCHPDAEPSFQRIAGMMRDAIDGSMPYFIDCNQWHRPLVDADDVAEVFELLSKGHIKVEDCEPRLNKISVGRCARVSYLTHDGKRDHAADIDLHDRLVKSGHWSPFEHVAQPIPPFRRLHEEHPTGSAYVGNFRGWEQYRKKFGGENIKVRRNG